MTVYEYLVRIDSGSRDDYWPVSLHRTFLGARSKIREILNERGTEIPSHFDSILENAESPVTVVYAGKWGWEIFIQRMTLED